MFDEKEKCRQDESDPQKMLGEAERKEESFPFLFAEEEIEKMAKKKGGFLLFQGLFCKQSSFALERGGDCCERAGADQKDKCESKRKCEQKLIPKLEKNFLT